MEDRDIIKLYFERDERAIAETERKYGRLCQTIARNVTGDEQDAQECVNDTYLGTWNAIPPERPRYLGAFVAKIARNIALDKLKYKSAQKRTHEAVISLSELEEIIADEPELEELEGGALGRMISDFLYTEDEVTRKIFIRKYFYLDSIADLSDKYGYSESKIKSMLHRTRNKLKKYLSEKGVAI